jgi:hypothetical protein
MFNALTPGPSPKGRGELKTKREADMDKQPNQPPRSRENMLAISLVMIGGGIILFYLYLITLGIIANIIAGIGLFVLVGALHYFVWGRSFSAEVAAEREAILRKEKQEEQAKAVPPGAIQDISRTQGIQRK